MYGFETSRRRVVAGLILGSGAATAGFAQEAPQIEVDPAAARDFHRDSLTTAGEALGGELALSPAGLGNALKGLEERGLIDGNDFDVLLQLVDIIATGEAIPAIFDAVEAAFSSAVGALGDVAQVIAAVIADSVDYARDRLNDVPPGLAQRVIFHDVQGAISGAGAGAGISSIFPGIGTTVGAVIGALGGGVSASVIGYYDAAERSNA